MNIKYAYETLLALRGRINLIPQEVDRIVERDKEDILDINKDQLLLGRNADGELLTPGYTEDPFFSSLAAAEAYYKRKQRLYPAHKNRITHFINYPDKPPNTPNLIVRGDYHDGFYINVSNGNHFIGSMYIDAPDIERKYQNKLYGLAPLSLDYYWRWFMGKDLFKFLWDV